MLSGNHFSFIAVFVILFLGLYFGFDIRPKKQSLIEKSRAFKQESISISNYLLDSKKELSVELNRGFENLEKQLESVSSDLEKLEILEELAGRWYQIGFPLISGHFAEEIAKLKLDDKNAWSIAGTTFALALKNNTDLSIRQYCRKHAVNAFEMAISIDPEDIAHRINTALVYTDFPLEENPMKGIQMLLDLNTKFPESTAVLNQLGNLAMETRQFDRALERFSRTIEIDENNVEAICGMAAALEAQGLNSEANMYAEKCNLLVKNKN